MTMRDGILEELVDAVKALREAVVAQTEVIKKQTAVQAAEKRHRLTVDVEDDKTRKDLERVFDALFYADPNGKVTRSEIMFQISCCEDLEIRELIRTYNLYKVQSKGYRAFIEIARGKAKREFYQDGSCYLLGIARNIKGTQIDHSSLQGDFKL